MLKDKRFRMSTFGKKALSYWDYDDNSKKNVMRFNHTNSELQLEILKKWYPIGCRCRKRSSDMSYSWEIIGYDITIGGYYVIKVKNVDNNNYFYTLESSFITLRTEISPDDIKIIKRESKLNKLGF
jgi:hypothetical protein